MVLLPSGPLLGATAVLRTTEPERRNTVRQQPEQEPPRVTSRIERVWQVARHALELAALMAAYNQREGLAVAAKALAVLGHATVSWFLGRGHR